MKNVKFFVEYVPEHATEDLSPDSGECGALGSHCRQTEETEDKNRIHYGVEDCGRELHEEYIVRLSRAL